MNHKEQMLEVSLELFSRRGFSSVSVRDICGALSLKESALYYHFKNKESILDILFQRVDELVGKMRTEFENAFSVAENVSIREMQLVAVGFLTNYYCDSNVRRLAAMLRIERTSNPTANDKYLKLMYEMPLEQCTRVFGEMIRRGLVRDLPPELLAKEYLDIITIAFDMYVPGALDLDQGIQAACRDVEKEIGQFYEGVRK